MRKIVLLAVAALIVIGIGTWIGVRAFAGATGQPLVTMTGAKGPLTSLSDDSLVVY